MSAYGTVAGQPRLTMPDGSPLLYNPGVRTPYDREAVWASLTCPFCGKEEPAEYGLLNNHWLKAPGFDGFDWCQSNGMCIAQQLITNHISYYAKALRDRDARATYNRSNKFDEARCREMLAESMEHGAAHGIDGNKILSFFTGVTCKPCTEDKHERCFEEATWSAVAEDLVDCACTDKSHE